jgi:hypothetical protein
MEQTCRFWSPGSPSSIDLHVWPPAGVSTGKQCSGYGLWSPAKALFLSVHLKSQLAFQFCTLIVSLDHSNPFLWKDSLLQQAQMSEPVSYETSSSQTAGLSLSRRFACNSILNAIIPNCFQAHSLFPFSSPLFFSPLYYSPISTTLPFLPFLYPYLFFFYSSLTFAFCVCAPLHSRHITEV